MSEGVATRNYIYEWVIESFIKTIRSKHWFIHETVQLCCSKTGDSWFLLWLGFEVVAIYYLKPKLWNITTLEIMLLIWISELWFLAILVPVVDLYLAFVIFFDAWSSLFTRTLHTNIWRNKNFIRDKIVVVCVSVSKLSKLFSYTANKYWIGLRWFISFEIFKIKYIIMMDFYILTENLSLGTEIVQINLYQKSIWTKI